MYDFEYKSEDGIKFTLLNQNNQNALKDEHRTKNNNQFVGLI